MERNGISLPHSSQHVERSATLDHEVLGDDLDEIHWHSRVRKEIRVVRLAKAHAEMMFVKHGGNRFSCGMGRRDRSAGPETLSALLLCQAAALLFAGL